MGLQCNWHKHTWYLRPNVSLSLSLTLFLYHLFSPSVQVPSCGPMASWHWCQSLCAISGSSASPCCWWSLWVWRMGVLWGIVGRHWSGYPFAHMQAPHTHAERTQNRVPTADLKLHRFKMPPPRRWQFGMGLCVCACVCKQMTVHGIVGIVFPLWKCLVLCLIGRHKYHRKVKKTNQKTLVVKRSILWKSNFPVV